MNGATAQSEPTEDPRKAVGSNALFGPFVPYAQERGDIPQDASLYHLLDDARRVLVSLKGTSSCHEAVEKWVGMIGKGKPVRGYFYPNFEHSWIDMGKFVLDIYPVGGHRPHLVARTVARWLYRERPEEHRLGFCPLCLEPLACPCQPNVSGEARTSQPK